MTTGDADKEMMARVLAGQEHLTVEQQLRNVCESFSIVQKDNVRLYELADKQDDEIERLRSELAELRKYSIAACSEMGCFCGDEEGEEKCSMCVLGEVIRAFDEPTQSTRKSPHV